MLTAEAPVHREAPPMPSTRRQNRETFVRLFQGFVNEYGEVVGKKIVKHIVDNAGGMRICIPENNPKLNQTRKWIDGKLCVIDTVLYNDPLYGCSACFRMLWVSTCQEFKQSSGRAIMHKIIVELGGRRVYFPNYRDLYKWERNEKMKNQYTGGNIDEIAERWSMSRLRALQIVTGEDE